MAFETGKKDETILNTSVDSYIKSVKQKALFEAAESGDYGMVSHLLSLGVSTDAPDFRREKYTFKHTMTPLHVAAKNGHHECLQLLIDHGANIDAKDEYDCTALHKAAEKGNHLCLKALLQAGSDCWLPIECRSSHMASPYLDCTTALHLAAQNNRVDCVKELLNSGADFNAVDVNGHTSLYIATKAGFDSCVMAHLKHPRSLEILSFPSYDTHDTPLHFAVKKKMVECVEELVRLGFDVNHVNKNGFSPLTVLCDYASSSNFVEEQILKHLVLGGKNVNINYLLRRLINRNKKMAKFLISCGADLNVIGVETLIRSEICNRKDGDFLKYLVKSLPVLPRLKSLGIIRHSPWDILSGRAEDWQGLTLPDKAKFSLVTDSSNIYVEIWERDNEHHKPPLKRSVYPLKEPLLKLVYNHIIKELTCPYCHLKPHLKVHACMPKWPALLRLEKQLWYEQKTSKPLTLQHYCRFTIRKNIGPSKVRQIQKLPLPQKLQSYLLYEHDESKIE